MLYIFGRGVLDGADKIKSFAADEINFLVKGINEFVVMDELLKFNDEVIQLLKSKGITSLGFFKS